MKKTTAWILWGICVILVVVGLVRMFIGTIYWPIYATIVGIGFYFTQSIFKKYLIR